jgi:hypothetical protein
LADYYTPLKPVAHFLTLYTSKLKILITFDKTLADVNTPNRGRCVGILEEQKRTVR